MRKPRVQKGQPAPTAKDSSKSGSKSTPKATSNVPRKAGAKGVKPTQPPKLQQPEVPSVELHIPANTEYVRVARMSVTAVASRMNFSYEDIEDIKLAVSEACNNAILHANPHPEQKRDSHVPTVRVKVTAYPDRLEISVADEGSAASSNLRSAAKRAASARDNAAATLPESGFGLLLIQSLMDTIEHEDDGQATTTIRMTKYIQGHRSSPPTL